jgi:hypothetical protein
MYKEEYTEFPLDYIIFHFVFSSNKWTLGINFSFSICVGEG